MDVARALEWGGHMLRESGIDTAARDVEILLQELLGMNRSALYLDRNRALLPEQEMVFQQWIEQRCARMPLQYILRKAWFMDMELYVDERVLIPRPETELLVEAVVQEAKGMPEPPQILDIGTGSGAIAIALARYMSGCRVWAVDISLDALAVARINVEKYGLQQRVALLEGDLFEPVKGMAFDIIVSNPPYIARNDLMELAPEVRSEPELALNGGQDGLDFYRKLCHAGELLKPHGFLALEIGYDQGRAVSDILRKCDFKDVRVLKDFAGMDRIVLAYKWK
ncbi:peptide chain release factor N(5)-glutamine methyltransferase [Mahella sp.]|uniref:peptide chain release factor N(5)-glutamine methyltransferase n=1 Tax=Mahella sp. TaxID=2798721 RepID=UPI0025C6CBF8|nr:peptide chain release factor N(5)-glutamine methyltransferase [Mahella sp.]MBZ4665126.1 protein-(glutamine-N5) methyltransferase, release factor-specific [Mahella sp.]